MLPALAPATAPAMAMASDDDEYHGFSMTQDLIEWEESQEVDLRTLATRSTQLRVTTPASTRKRSGHITATPAPRTHTTNTKEMSAIQKKEYSPGQEVEGILNLMQKDSNGPSNSDPLLEAVTQPHGNRLVRSTTHPPPSTSAAGIMRHRRKRRVDNDVQQDRKRLPQVKSGRRVRPRSADSSEYAGTSGLSIMAQSMGFDDLLKQLDQPESRRKYGVPTRGSHPQDSICPQPHLMKQSAPIRLINQQLRPTQSSTGKENQYPTNQYLSVTKKTNTANNMDHTADRTSLSMVGDGEGALDLKQHTASHQLLLHVNRTQSKCHDNPRKNVIIPPITKTAPRNNYLNRGYTKPTATLAQPAKMQSPMQNSRPVSISTTHVHIDNDAVKQILPSSAPASTSEPTTACNVDNRITTSKTTPSLQFENDLEFSAEDLAALDAVMFEANKARLAQNPPTSGCNVPSLQVNVGVLPTPASVKTREPVEDPFGDAFCDDLFTQMDFDALDRKIEQRASLDSVANEVRKYTSLETNAPQTPRTRVLVPPPLNVPVRNMVSAGFDPSTCFLSFSRYRVVAVVDDMTSYTKTVVVKVWRTDMLDDLRDKSIHRFSTSFAPKKKEFGLEHGDGSIFLRGEWYHTRLDSGDIVHLCSLSGKYETKPFGLPVVLHTTPPVGSDQNDDLVLVVHPDLLVPPTIISETVSCSRRAVLKSRLGSTGLNSKAALFGTMRHDLFERSMRSQDFSIETAKEYVHTIVRENAESLVAVGITDAEAQREVIRVVQQIQQFAIKYTEFGMSKSNPQVSSGRGSTLEGNGVQPDLHFLAHQVHATEESLLSPELGLKGNIDCTIKATTSEVHIAGRPAEPQTVLSSIELKTGHNQATQNAHMAQLALYTLMLKIRYGSGIGGAGDSGMLLYLNNDGFRAVRVKPMLNEFKSLIGQRNLVATELRRSSRPRGIVLKIEDDSTETGVGIDLLPAPPTDLPEVLTSTHSCKMCYSNRECMMYYASDANNAPQHAPSRGVYRSHGQLLNHFTGHLEPDDLNYFRDWDRLMDLEADATIRLTTSSWLMDSMDGEAESGTTVSSLILELGAIGEQSGTEDKQTVNIVARRSKDSPLATHFTSMNIESGNHVIVSTDTTSLCEPEKVNSNGHRSRRKQMQIARGYIDSIKEDQIVIRFSVQEYSQIALYARKTGTAVSMEEIKFRLDKDDVSTGIGTLRQNLINLFTTDITPFGSKESDPRLTQGTLVRNRFSWLRDVVVRLRTPFFGDLPQSAMFMRPSGNAVSVPGCSLEHLRSEFWQLNDDQKRAVEKVFQAKDFSLIQGMPGTGK